MTTQPISPALFDFLRALRANNERPWFEANKARYREEVRDPMLDFIAAFAGPLAEISPHFRADPRPNGGSLFRIYRDTRFSKDKTPYKTNVGAHFRHAAGRDAHAPGFYLHLEPEPASPAAASGIPTARRWPASATPSSQSRTTGGASRPAAPSSTPLKCGASPSNGRPGATIPTIR